MNNFYLVYGVKELNEKTNTNFSSSFGNTVRKQYYDAALQYINDIRQKRLAALTPVYILMYM